MSQQSKINGEFVGSPPYRVTTVTVKRIKGKRGKHYSPCGSCIYRNVVKNAILFNNNTHALYIRDKSYHQNLNSGQGQAYIETIGICPSFTQELEAL